MLNLTNYDFSRSVIPQSLGEKISSLTNAAGRIVCKNRDVELEAFCQSNNTTLRELRYMLTHNIYQFSFCKVCGKKTTKLGAIYCSCSCRNKDKDWQKKFEQTSLQKYGTKHPSSSEVIRQKVSTTNEQRYGYKCSLSNPDVKSKAIITMMQRYGNDNYFKTDKFKKDLQDYNQQHYGVQWSSQRDDVKQKKLATMNARYGGNCPASNKIVANKIKNTTIERYGNDFVQNHLKDSVRQLYGVDNISQTQMWKESFKSTCLKRFGCEHPQQNEDVRQRSILTSRYNLYPKFCNNILKKGYVCLSDINTFVDYQQPLLLRHTCGNIKQCYTRIAQQIHVCDCVQHSVSSKEMELRQIILSLVDDKVEFNNRNILKGKELDIYIPSKQLAFEFNGNYWHSTEHIDDGYYHINKTLMCYKKGIRLIHIFEWDWDYKKDAVMAIIKNSLELNDCIDFSQCTLAKITHDEYRQFMSLNALVCDVPFQCFGLKHHDELVYAFNINHEGLCVNHSSIVNKNVVGIRVDWPMRVDIAYEPLQGLVDISCPQKMYIRNQSHRLDDSLQPVDESWLAIFKCGYQIQRWL